MCARWQCRGNGQMTHTSLMVDVSHHSYGSAADVVVMEYRWQSKNINEIMSCELCVINDCKGNAAENELRGTSEIFGLTCGDAILWNVVVALGVGTILI